ncbi:hypothetical protein QWY31_06780 [Cytophagales bacterium LB-30]|uniref:LVIVD repeat-containing protein n=1 Tax=Shiella aurantiaca TaxID=3058365 RepID=A0ABT8F4H7_9BACT|nr:hypothetical protein [Shiella aurantiaca]MDN4165198.1 hypothetical protein [Shiella aurantiaca]
MKRLLNLCALMSLIGFLMACESSDGGGLPTSGTGQGGSTARFTILGEFLYVVDNATLRTFSLENPTEPEFRSVVDIDDVVETIYGLDDKLFIGSQNGMYIYDVSIPEYPDYVGAFSHIQACDPVIPYGNYAYVTLRGGTGCRNAANNQLDVLDITDIQNPFLIQSIPMSNPHGLGISGQLLFVAEAYEGIKVFNISNPEEPLQVGHYREIHVVDVILHRGLLIATGRDGVHQFDYTNPTELQLVSSLTY